jgi:hypothetical protein
LKQSSFRIVGVALGVLLVFLWLLGRAPTRLAAQGGTMTRVPIITKPEPVAPGVYPLYDYRNLSKEQYHVVGGHQSFDWRELEQSEGVYTWARLDNWIAAESNAGKPVAIGIEIYNPSREYRIPDYVVEGAPPVLCGSNGSRKVPRYWSPYFQEKYANFIRAFGERYRDDERVVWIQIGAGIYQETQPETNTYKQCVRDAMAADIGTDDAEALSVTWMEAVNAMQQPYREAFGDSKPLMLQYVPYFLNYWERDGLASSGYVGFVPFAVENLIGFKHDGLLPDHWVGTGYNPIKNNWGLVHGAFEPPSGYTIDEEIYWAVFAALDAHADYLALHPNHFLDDCGNVPGGCGYDMEMVFAAYDFFNAYAGKRPENTPGAWVALRDSWYYHGSHDNYSWLLYQDFDAPGGLSQAVSYMEEPTRPDQRWNLDMLSDFTLPITKEGRWTRRTDEASGNPDMYFNVDDAYIYSGTTAIEFQITYLDRGTDQWRLVYDAPGITETIGYTQTKTDTDDWLTATFVVNDAEFANDLFNNDFRLESMSDGDEYFHLIKITPTRPRICPWGDRDGNGEVAVGDLLLLEQFWRQANHQHDHNADGVITLLDLLGVALEWGQRCRFVAS